MSLMLKLNKIWSTEKESLVNDIAQNISDLFSTKAPILNSGPIPPYLHSSILNLGLKNFIKIKTPENEIEFINELVDLIINFEPRLTNVTASVVLENTSENILNLNVSAELVLNNNGEILFFDSFIDLNNSTLSVRNISFV